jgi:hypothetical protein
MKFIKWVGLIFLLVSIVLILFRGWIFRNTVSYKSIGDRKNYHATDKKLVEFTETNPTRETAPTVESIIKKSLDITSQQLRYSSYSSKTNPNKLIYTGEAHCVGYASFFTTLCNGILEKHKLSDQWIAKAKVGQLYFFDVNIHQYFSSPFFKDHDFVVIENQRTGQTFSVDPTVSDYLYIDFVTFNN